jgi:DnaJ domain
MYFFSSFGGNSDCSCFDRIGISPNSTEREIKKAYRRLAVLTHPDKAPLDQVEQATIAFRELHEAYEECLSKCAGRSTGTNTGSSSGASRARSRASKRRDSSSSHRRDNDRRSERHEQRRHRYHNCSQKSDEEIKKTFQDVCDEMEREAHEGCAQSWQQCLNDLRAAWPNKPECWNAMERSAVSMMNVEKLAAEIHPFNPELAQFLLERKAQWSPNVKARQKQELDLRLERIQTEWPIDREGLKRWAKSWEVTIRDWEKTISLITDSEAASAFTLWRKEHTEEWTRQRDEEKISAADRIVEVFPDAQAIKSILYKFCYSERRKIYDLLPVHIQSQLVLHEVSF